MPAGASDFMRVDTVIYWHSIAGCFILPALSGASPGSGASPTANGDNPETISRFSTILASPPRTIFYRNDPRAPDVCNPYQMFSRVVADHDSLYWVDAAGLEKLSKDANPGDAPQLLSAAFGDRQPYDIAIGSQFVYLSRGAYLGCGVVHCIEPALLRKADKTSGAVTTLLGGLINPHYGFNLKVDPEERYLYYLETIGRSNDLRRMDLSNPATIQTLSADVTGYFPEGSRRFCALNWCFFTDYVFIGHGNTAAGQTHDILRYDNVTSNVVTVYTSADTTDSVSINDIVSDGTNIFFYELRGNICLGPPCFVTYTAWLFRSGRANANGLANIYQTVSNISISINSTFGLDDDGAKIYWLENGAIKRLSNEASALPKPPMHVVGMEVTQGVQTTANSVPLIRGKDTFVRLYVQSDDPSLDVPGVTARLRATWTGGTGGGSGDWIPAANLVAITVKRNPSRGQLNDAFLFELPWDWVSGDNLTLTAELNPGHNPEQSDNYTRNVLTVGPFHLNPTPRLEVRLLGYFYNMGGQSFGPAYREQFGNIDWIRRAYPVDDISLRLDQPGGGLHWAYTTVYDDALANKVRYPSVPCEDKDTTANPDSKLPDCQNLRASAYVASQIAGKRDDLRIFGDTDNTTYYGLVASGSELLGAPPVMTSYFPRGQDGGKNGAGPAGQSWLGWYAGHEVGHSVGMGHPAMAANANECGIKGSDSLPTYPHAHIGADDDTTNVEGFLNQPTYNYPRYDNTSLAAGSKTMDVMAYCLPQWLSDQNYVRIYQNLTGNAPTVSATALPQTNGDWLVIYGSIFSNSNTAAMDYIRHKIGDVTVPPITAGPYAIRLLSVGGQTLADYAFTPQVSGDAGVLSFGQAVAFAAGTRMVQIVRLSDGLVLASQAVAASTPNIGSLALVNPPDPVTGTVTLAWIASDPEGLPLTFDIFCSADDGASFLPVALHVSGTSRQIDAAHLDAGQGRFRVVASDGVNAAWAESVAYTMAAKPPVPVITEPADKIHAHFGQSLNFAGLAAAAGGGPAAGAALTWLEGSTTLGSGPHLTLGSLPPGTHVISLKAQSGAGPAAFKSITVYVDDNIDPDGPTMQVAPGAITRNVEAGVNTPQALALAVANVGRGSLTWQVSSDATWLTVTPASGRAGDPVAATADPSGLANGEQRTAHLTFTTTSNGTPQDRAGAGDADQGQPVRRGLPGSAAGGATTSVSPDHTPVISKPVGAGRVASVACTSGCLAPQPGVYGPRAARGQKLMPCR